MVRQTAIRVLQRSSTATYVSRPASRRTFAQAQGDVGDHQKVSTANSKIPIYVIGGVVIAAVAGRYILASDKPANAGQAEQIAAKRAGNFSGRDARDSPVKTLEQKKQKEQNS